MVALCALFHRRRSLPQAPERIGVLQPTAIGDTILSSGVFLCLREAFPDAEVHLFHGANNREAAGLIATQPILHAIDLLRPHAAIRALRSFRFDLLIDLCPWPRATALVVAAAQARCTLGFASAHQHRHYAFDLACRHSSTRHEIANLAELATLFGASTPYRVDVRRDLPRPRADRWFGAHEFVIFHPGAGGAAAAAKAWPAARWAALAELLALEGYPIALTGSAADQPLVGEVIARTQAGGINCLSLAGRLTLAEVAHLLQHCRLLVTVDNGVMHLASALDCPLVALHGPTSSRRWGPVSKSAIALDAPHPAAGYSCFGYERHHHAGKVMEALNVATVWNAVRQQLGKSRDRNEDRDPARGP
jgi:ADP-heptose:LPS heptosyltransferase